MSASFLILFFLKLFFCFVSLQQNFGDQSQGLALSKLRSSGILADVMEHLDTQQVPSFFCPT